MQKHHGVTPGKEISRVPLIEAFNTQSNFIITESPDEIAPAGSFESLIDYVRVSRRSEIPVEQTKGSSSEEDSAADNSDKTPRPGRYPCDQCGMVFAKLSHEIKHKKCHLSARPFPCPYCEKSFTADKGVKKHIFRLHPENSEKPIEISEEKTHFRAFLCLICKRSFRSKVAVCEHISGTHIGHTLRFPFVGHNSSLPGLQCPDCKQIYSVGDIETHSCSGPVMEDTEVCLQGNANGLFICPQCDAVCSRKDNLKSHLKKVHGVEWHQPEVKKEKKEFECETCGSKYINSTKLQEHMAVHMNDRPFTCEYCRKTLKNTRSLRMHIVSMHKPPSEPVDDPSGQGKHVKCEETEDKNCPICDTEWKDEGSAEGDQYRHHILSSHETEWNYIPATADTEPAPPLCCVVYPITTSYILTPSQDTVTYTHSAPVILSDVIEWYMERSKTPPPVSVVDWKQCPYCPKKYKRPGRLRNHLKICAPR